MKITRKITTWLPVCHWVCKLPSWSLPPTMSSKKTFKFKGTDQYVSFAQIPAPPSPSPLRSPCPLRFLATQEETSCHYRHFADHPPHVRPHSHTRARALGLSLSPSLPLSVSLVASPFFMGCRFRQRLVMATLAQKPVRFDEIRTAGTGEEVGLKDYEASFLRLLDKMTNGSVVSCVALPALFHLTAAPAQPSVCSRHPQCGYPGLSLPSTARTLQPELAHFRDSSAFRSISHARVLPESTLRAPVLRSGPG